MAKAPKWTKADAAKLAQVAANTLAGLYPRANPDDYKALAHYEHVEFNMNDVDPEFPGLFPIRATAQGIQESGVSTPGAIDPETTSDNMPEVINPANVAPTETKPVSETVENVVSTEAPATAPAVARNRLNFSAADIKVGVVSGLPEKPKGAKRGRQSAYPFHSLNAPVQGTDGSTQYSRFFLANTENRDDMLKLVQGNVTAYNGKVKKDNAVDPNTNALPKFEAFEMEVDGVKGVAVYRVQ